MIDTYTEKKLISKRIRSKIYSDKTNLYAQTNSKNEQINFLNIKSKL